MPARALRDPDQVRARLGRLREPHVAPLTEFVERLRAARGGGEALPWFDPADAGVHARVLLLYEAPGARAVGPGSPRPQAGGSGIISAENDDATAAATWALREEVGLRPELVVAWNVVPWYVGDGTRIRPVGPGDLEEAGPALRGLLALLPTLRVVVLAGRAAQRGWARHTLRDPSDLPVVPCPHPSPRVLNSTPGARARITHAFLLAALIAETDPPDR